MLFLLKGTPHGRRKRCTEAGEELERTTQSTRTVCTPSVMCSERKEEEDYINLIAKLEWMSSPSTDEDKKQTVIYIYIYVYIYMKAKTKMAV